MVELSLVDGVGAVGVPVSAGLASGALGPTALCTNAVVAIAVELSPKATFGAVGTPVSAGLFKGA